jgi:hypothetical protein
MSLAGLIASRTMGHVLLFELCYPGVLGAAILTFADECILEAILINFRELRCVTVGHCAATFSICLHTLRLPWTIAPEISLLRTTGILDLSKPRPRSVGFPSPR